MRRFGSNNPCPKCGDQGGTVLFQREIKWDNGTVSDERIRRQCTRCGYEWHEAPLDAPGASLAARHQYGSHPHPDDCQKCADWVAARGGA